MGGVRGEFICISEEKQNKQNLHATDTKCERKSILPSKLLHISIKFYFQVKEKKYDTVKTTSFMLANTMRIMAASSVTTEK